MVILDKLERDVRFLTIAHLRLVLADMVKFAPPWEQGGLGFLTLGLATEILRFFLGNDWVDSRVLGDPDDHKHHPTSRFLHGPFHGAPGDAAQDWHRRTFRTASLAEHMFNLQHVEGALERFVRVRDDDLGAALAELESASLLSAPRLRLRFRNPVGVFGKDYEGTVVGDRGRVVPWEAKSKLSSSTPSDEAIWRSLDEARKQLPKEAGGLILLRLPEEWSEEVATLTCSEQAVARLFRQTRRVAGVVCFSHQWMVVRGEEPGDVLSKPMIRSWPNPFLADANEEVKSILALVGRRFNQEWVQIQGLVMDHLPATQAREAHAYHQRVKTALRNA